MIRLRSFAAFAAALLGCSAEDAPADDAAGALRLYPVPGCESLDHTPCDVRAAACQTRLLALAACLRGNEPGDLPPIEMIAKDEYARRMTEALEASPRPEPDHEEVAFALLGLIPPDGFGTEALVAEAVEFVGGFYESDSKAITLVDAGQDLSERDWSALMVHEFIHLLQDREFPFADRHEQYVVSEDTWFALRALTEGEAQFHGVRYLASVSGFDPAKVPLGAFFASRIARDESELVLSEAPYLLAPYRFPYDWGGRYLEHIWRDGGLAAIHERFADPPTTTHALMSSETAEYILDFEPTTPAGTEAPAEWVLTHENTLGALGTFLALGQHHADADRSRSLALSWRGDRVLIYGAADDSGMTAVVWRLDFADEASAASVASALGASARAVGTRVTLAQCSGPVALDWAF